MSTGSSSGKDLLLQYFNASDRDKNGTIDVCLSLFLIIKNILIIHVVGN